MKKKLLVLVLTALVLCTVLAFAGIASAAVSIEAKTEYFMGEYNNLFADREDINGEGYLAKYGKDAVIVFGSFAGDDFANYDIGMVFYPENETYESEDAKLFLAKKIDDNGNFGIALSFSGDLLDSGKWNVKSFYKAKEDALTIANCEFSDSTAVFSTTTERYATPTVTVGGDAIVTWSEVEGASAYKVQVQKEARTVLGDAAGYEYPWETVAVVEDGTTWDSLDYLKTLSVAELHEIEGRMLKVRVAADGYDKAMSEYAVGGNIFGQNSDGIQFRLKVVENEAELKASSLVSGQLDYLVLTDDITIEGNVAKENMTSGSGQYSHFGSSLSNVAINGLGHKITYVYDDTQSTFGASSDWRFGLWIGTNTNVPILNLSIDATITSKMPGDALGVSVLTGASFNGSVYNSFFKVRANVTQITPDSRTRTRIALSNGGTATWENCVFDMVTYDKDGKVVSGGEDWFDQVLSGGSATVTNCSFITNGASTSKPWVRNASNQTVNNSNMYVGVSAFTAAWDSFDAETKASYEDAGFSVVDGSVYYNGNLVIEKEIILYAPVNYAYNNAGVYTWDEMPGAEGYNAQVYVDGTLSDTKTVTDNRFSVSNWLAGLDATTLDSLDGKKIEVAVQSIATGTEPSDYTSKLQLTNLNSSAVNVSDTVIQIVKSVDDIREVNAYTSYMVLANDIILNEEQTEGYLTNSAAGSSSAYYVVNGLLEGTFDGIGHTISYVINEDANGSTHRGSLFGTANPHSRFLNTIVKADITRPFVDGYFTSVLAYSNGGVRAYNCYFDLKLTTTAETDSFAYTRSSLFKQNAALSYLYNCIFNLRSYKSDGTLREGASGKCEGSIGWENGSRNTLTNCVYIKNSTKSYKTTGTTEVDVLIANYMEDFITAWNNDTLANKSTYVDAGWSVDGTTVKLWGTAIN